MGCGASHVAEVPSFSEAISGDSSSDSSCTTSESSDRHGADSCTSSQRGVVVPLDNRAGILEFATMQRTVSTNSTPSTSENEEPAKQSLAIHKPTQCNKKTKEVRRVAQPRIGEATRKYNGSNFESVFSRLAPAQPEAPPAVERRRRSSGTSHEAKPLAPTHNHTSQYSLLAAAELVAHDVRIVPIFQYNSLHTNPSGAERSLRSNSAASRSEREAGFSSESSQGVMRQMEELAGSFALSGSARSQPHQATCFQTSTPMQQDQVCYPDDPEAWSAPLPSSFGRSPVVRCAAPRTAMVTCTPTAAALMLYGKKSVTPERNCFPSAGAPQRQNAIHDPSGPPDSQHANGNVASGMEPIAAASAAHQGLCSSSSQSSAEAAAVAHLHTASRLVVVTPDCYDGCKKSPASMSIDDDLWDDVKGGSLKRKPTAKSPLLPPHAVPLRGGSVADQRSPPCHGNISIV